MDHTKERCPFCSIRSAEVNGNIQRTSRAAADRRGNDRVEVAVESSVSHIEETDGVDNDKPACGWLFVDDERFRGSGALRRESSRSADGVVGPVQRDGIVGNVVPGDIPEVVDYGENLRIGIWDGEDDGVGPRIESGIAGGAGLVLSEDTPCCCKKQERDVRTFHPIGSSGPLQVLINGWVMSDQSK